MWQPGLTIKKSLDGETSTIFGTVDFVDDTYGSVTSLVALVSHNMTSQTLSEIAKQDGHLQGSQCGADKGAIKTPKFNVPRHPVQN
jgi:hypothetical protein